ncbi:MAG: PD-(D/E)XK nuclease family protein, partial [Rhodothermales bacterium]
MGNQSNNKSSPIFSAHSLQTYVDCPRRYELGYLEGLVWPAVEREPVLDSERFLENGRIFHEMVHRDILGIPVANPKQAEILEWWQNYLSYQPANIDGSKYPEKTLVGEVNDHVLTATYDLIVITPEGKAKIYDWKTWRHPERVKDVGLRLQSRIYPFLLVEQAAAIIPSLKLTPEDVEMVYWLAERPAEPIVINYDQATYSADKDYLETLVDEVLST